MLPAPEANSRKSKPPVESAVTRLLVSIKQLLESLTQWSTLKVDENTVSDVYVRLGNDFNSAVAAFAGYGIDMAELMSVPDDLRNVLEQCLAEEATPDNLELYLPTVRRIITDLLTGLRGKQSVYRRLQHRSDSGSGHKSGDSGSGHERTDSRSSRGERTSKTRGEAGHRTQTSRTVTDGERPDRENTPRRSGQSSLSSKKVESNLQGAVPSEDDRFVGGFAPPILENSQPTPEVEEENTAVPVDSRIKQRIPSASDVHSPASPHRSLPSSPAPNPLAEKAPPTPAVQASVKRYSLVDKPMSPPAVVVEPSSPGQDFDSASASPAPETPPPELPPAMANSLAALKKNDVLERRASKRFSTFNISKMTGSSTLRERPGRSGHPNRRSFAASSALTPGELAVLTEEGDDEGPLGTTSTSLRHEGSARSRSISRANTPEKRQDTPPVPKLPKTPHPPTTKELTHIPTDQSPDIPSDASKMTVFLQVGREVKKAVVEADISFASLRVLFVDKFSYNPGQDNFPAIYIRDPSSGVQYELEDTDEVKDKCLLSLNIEPLDQIKQHIDAKILGLSTELMELKTAVASSSARQPMLLPNIIAESLAESTPLANRPTDRQFQHVARRLSRFVGDSSSSPFQSIGFSQMQPQMTGQSLQPQMTGASVLSDYSSRVVTDLKTQFDEVQNLRRDLGIMRQLYTEFMKQTKESLSTLKTQTHSVKQLANTGVGGARGYIDTGKKKLDSRSQNVLTEVEKLLDTVDAVKDDVTKRQITPKELYMKTIKRDIDSVSKELDSLKEHIKTIKPMWKKTWEEELQNIVEEQQFLTHQEEFLGDLVEDHKSVVEMYGHIQKVVSLRNPGPNGSIKPRSRSFRPPPPSEGDGLSNVMLEIRGAAVDPEKRMKAIEANQKNRQKELEARSDDLHAELHDFVGQKKLRMTGGAEEAERVRQKRSEMTLKAMFNVNNSASPSLSGSDLPPSPPS
ncbi:hypothetical protein H0H87_003518 [Tephrocybe sp. NHM501043]|nr:hypothetical protein H0H87_003518 [Tephrocybe sp. NHM501043]